MLDSLKTYKSPGKMPTFLPKPKGTAPFFQVSPDALSDKAAVCCGDEIVSASAEGSAPVLFQLSKPRKK